MHCYRTFHALLSGKAFNEQFEHQYTKICKHFLGCPDNIAPLVDALRNRKLITNGTVASVKYPDGTGPYDKATKMLTEVQQTLQDNPHYQSKFISALRECELDAIIRILEKYVYWVQCLTGQFSLHNV